MKKLTEQEFLERIQKIRPDITIKPGTYKGRRNFCTFIHPIYGEFKRHAGGVLVQQYLKHPTQNHDIMLKIAKSSNFRYILQHWKTSKDVVCVGSYEKSVVEYLNNNKMGRI
jgi:hypothetical protein